MIEYFLWVVSFISLFVGIFWTQVIFMPVMEQKNKIENFPLISLLIPAWNEENTLKKTVDSLIKLDYPKEKLQIIIVNDGSTDNTQEVAKQLIKDNKSYDIILINRTRTLGQFTKAPALNCGLEHVKGKYVGCLDSDSTVAPDVLQLMIPLFEEEKVGAVITAIKVLNPDNLWSKIQRLEYILATFVRDLMSRVNTLHITPGALSLYDSHLLKELGGFDEKNITEDYEIAMRLKFNGYNIKIVTKAISYTYVPNTFKSLWDQRVRWFRGFIVTMSKYKKMFGNKSLGMMGVFQYPLNLISFFVIILSFALSFYMISKAVYIWFIKIIILKGGIFETFHVPEIKEIIFRINLKVFFPIFVAFAIALYLYHLAHRNLGEKWKYPLASLSYFFLYPPLRTAHWVTATYKELFKKEEKW